MSLAKLAILGVLMEKPMCGYKLKQYFETTTGVFWMISYGSIYPTLSRLVGEKCIVGRKEANKTEFIAVTIPEALGVYQTERLLTEFDGYGLNVGHMIIHNVVEEPDCEFHKIRMETQREYIERLEKGYGRQMKIVEIPLFPYEIKGIERLRQVEKILFT